MVSAIFISVLAKVINLVSEKEQCWNFGLIYAGISPFQFLNFCKGEFYLSWQVPWTRESERPILYRPFLNVIEMSTVKYLLNALS